MFTFPVTIDVVDRYGLNCLMRQDPLCRHCTQCVDSNNKQADLVNLSLTLSLPIVLRSAKFKTEEKVLSFILQNCQKQTEPHESTAQ